jgi:hypothetical protein
MIEAQTRLTAREEFLRQIKRTAPQVLSELAKDALPIYRDIYPINIERKKESSNVELALFYFTLMNWRDLQSPLFPVFFRELKEPPNEARFIENEFQKYPKLSDDLKNLHEKLSNLENALRRWSERFNLTDEWCLDHALQTLAHWVSSGELENFDWQYKLKSYDFEESNGDGIRTFKYLAWNPKADTWSSYKQRTEKALAEELANYRKQVEQSIKADKQYIAREKTSGEHYKWLVYFQIEGLTVEGVIIKYQLKGLHIPSRSAVSEAIYSLASLIDLTPHTEIKNRERKKSSQKDNFDIPF